MPRKPPIIQGIVLDSDFTDTYLFDDAGDPIDLFTGDEIFGPVEDEELRTALTKYQQGDSTGADLLDDLHYHVGLHQLETLILNYYMETSLPEILPELNLKALKLHKLDNLATLPSWLGKLKTLQELEFARLPAVKTIPNLSGLGNLERLLIKCMPGLIHLPGSLGKLKNLQTLYLIDLEQVKHIPKEVDNLTHLAFIETSELTSLASLPSANHWVDEDGETDRKTILADIHSGYHCKFVRANPTRQQTGIIEANYASGPPWLVDKYSPYVMS